MGNVAIRVENLGKMYHIGGPQERYRTFRDAIVHTAAAPVYRVRDVLQGRSASNLREEVWALKDISFEVKRGEVIGIIGRNGAGKSTLLKILSSITDPTTGYANVYGRIGALLEVGTGFHPELTGRENVYLNGAILGMSRRDIDRKFDEIVAFSGIEKFIDTPVKHYSSGMGLRLGFSVAAHLEPEILVIDEVLAVGDAEFQQKCIGKMSNVAGEGRTILFVSHNMLAVRHLCNRGFYLKNGQLEYTNDVDSVVDYYLHDAIRVTSTADLEARTDRTGGKIFRFLKIELLDAEGNSIEFARAGKPMQFRAEYMHTMDPRDIRTADFFVRLDDSAGLRLFTLATQFTHTAFEGIPTRGVVMCRLDEVPLVAGKYSVALSGSINGKSADFIENALDFTVEEGDVYGTGRFPVRERNGVFIVTDYHWSLN